jgi:hypothetical protein
MILEAPILPLAKLLFAAKSFTNVPLLFSLKTAFCHWIAEGLLSEIYIPVPSSFTHVGWVSSHQALRKIALNTGATNWGVLTCSALTPNRDIDSNAARVMPTRMNLFFMRG